MKHHTEFCTMIPFPTATALLQKQVNSMNEKNDMKPGIAYREAENPISGDSDIVRSIIHLTMNQGFLSNRRLLCVSFLFLSSLWCFYWYSTTAYFSDSSFLM